MKMQLRPYQQSGVEQMRNEIRAGNRRLILCAPTGAGKTFIFSYMVSQAVARGKRTLIVTDRVELMKQSGGALRNFGLDPIEIKAGRKLKSFNGVLYTAMVETLARRMKKGEYKILMMQFDLIIFDEAHKQAFNKLFEWIADDTVVIGATATPHRERNQKSLDSFYQSLVEVTDITMLVQDGYLATPVTYGVAVDLSNVTMRGRDYDENSQAENYSRNKVYKGVVENYKRLTLGKKALVFSANIASSQELCREFEHNNLPVRHLDSNMSKVDREEILNWFNETPDAILCNVGILTTGFDEPTIEVVILYRATTSLPLFLQMVGRGSRTTETKKSFTILDFGDNVRRHGFWEAPREWSLKKAKKKRKEQAAPVKTCPKCEAMVYASVRVCGYCDHIFEFTKEQEQEEEFAQLRLLTPRQVRNIARRESIEKKAAMAKEKLIKPYWVLHQLKSYDEAKYFAELLGWNWRGWWYHNRKRFPNLHATEPKQKAYATK